MNRGDHQHDSGIRWISLDEARQLYPNEDFSGADPEAPVGVRRAPIYFQHNDSISHALASMRAYNAATTAIVDATLASFVPAVPSRVTPSQENPMNPQYDTRTVRNSSHNLVGSTDAPTNQPTSIYEALAFIGEQQNMLSDAVVRARARFAPVLRPDVQKADPRVDIVGAHPIPCDPTSDLLEELRTVITRNREIEASINNLIDNASELIR